MNQALSRTSYVGLIGEISLLRNAWPEFLKEAQSICKNALLQMIYRLSF